MPNKGRWSMNRKRRRAAQQFGFDHREQCEHCMRPLLGPTWYCWKHGLVESWNIAVSRKEAAFFDHGLSAASWENNLLTVRYRAGFGCKMDRAWWVRSLPGPSRGWDLQLRKFVWRSGALQEVRARGRTGIRGKKEALLAGLISPGAPRWVSALLAGYASLSLSAKS